MAISVVMPALEMAQQTGKLIAWLKQEGDSVCKGEALLEIETDKAVMEIEAPGDGVLAGITAEPGAEVPVGEIIGWILAAGETIPDEAPSDGHARVPGVDRATGVSISTQATHPSAAAAGLLASPKARRLAREHGVQLNSIAGSGPSGEIHSSNILSAKPAVRPSPATTITHLGTLARLMAERTTHSWTTVPHFIVVREIIAEQLIKARDEFAPTVEQSAAVKLTFSDLLVALIGTTLVRHPRVNARWDDGQIHENSDINIALAIAVTEGVVAPVIRRANDLSLSGIATRRREMTDRSKAGKLQPADLADATFTISNLGMYGVDAFTAIINPPQAAILAVGTIGEKVVAVDGSPAVRRGFTLTLSCDHRVLDGAKAAAFMSDLAKAIEDPARSCRP